jgi:hypothetical protein
VPVERYKSIAVTLIGLTTMLWGGAHIALGVFCYLPGDHWVGSAFGFAPVHWIARDTYENHVDIAFRLQGILGMLAGWGVLLRLQQGRILTFIVAIVAILWALDSVDAYKHQNDDYQWKTALIPFAAAQVLYGILAVVILIKNGAAFSERGGTGQSGVGRPIYVWAAWASPSAGVAIFVALWVLNVIEQGARGKLPPAVLLLSVVLLFLSSVAGGLAGVISLFGIRSWRNALSIIPGALLGICINGFLALICLVMCAYAYQGRPPGG